MSNDVHAMAVRLCEYGDYLKAVKLATCGVRLVTCDPDDIRYGYVLWEDLPSAI